MPKKRRRHPPQSPLEQFFSGLKDTVLDFVEDTAYDLHDALLRAQEEQTRQQARSQVPPPRPGKAPRTGRTQEKAVVTTPTHYSVLGVAQDCPPEVIQAAWKALARIHHPDLPKGNAERMKRINAAYETLSDPKKRRAYDRTL